MEHASVGKRHYGMDWLRIGAFGLLIFYHIGMFFVPWGWHVKSSPVEQWVTIPMLFTNGWRLALLFLVSGYASAAILAKNPSIAGFVRSRSARLLVPLAFGMALVVAPQPWVELMGKHGYPHGFGHFWLHDYFRFDTLEGLVLPTWQHLWFVAYLWPYSLALAVLAALPLRIRDMAARAFSAIFRHPLLLVGLPIGWILLRSLLFWPGVSDTHALFDDLPAHWIFFAAFLFGFALRRGRTVLETMERAWPWALALGLASYALFAALEWRYPGDTPAPVGLITVFIVARAVNAWCMIVALVGMAGRFLDRDHPARATLNEAIFPFYIIHQTIIVLVGWMCLRAGLSNAISFVVIVLMTIGGCWLFYAIGRAIPGVRLLIGLKGWRRPA